MEWFKKYQNQLNSSFLGFMKSNDAWLKHYQTSISPPLQSLLESNNSWLKQYQNPLNSSLQSFMKSNDAWLKHYQIPINSPLQSLLESNSSWLQNYKNPLNSSLQNFIKSNNALLKQYEHALSTPWAENPRLNTLKNEEDFLRKYFNTAERISIDQEFIDTIQAITDNAVQNLELGTNQEFQDIDALLPAYIDITGSEKLSDHLKHIPGKAKVVFIWILYHVLFLYTFLLIQDVSVGVVSDKVKPVVSDFIFGKPTASIKEIRNLSRTMPDIEFTNIRFVSVEGLNVRKTPNSKGEVIDKLPRTEVVTLIAKNENLSWSLVRYKNQDEEVMQGWVFSRYLKKFK